MSSEPCGSCALPRRPRNNTTPGPSPLAPGPSPLLILDTATCTPKSPTTFNDRNNPRHLRVSTYRIATRYIPPGYMEPTV